MKANKSLIMAMATIVALAFVGCNKAEIENGGMDAKAGDLVVSATIPTTKVSIASGADGYAMTWDTNDKVKLVSAGTAYESSAITVSSDKKTAEFTFSGAAGISGEYEIFAPASAYKSVAEAGATVQILQSQSSKSTCPNGFVLWGKGSSSDLNVHFRHLASYVKMHITGLDPNVSVHHVTVYLWGSNLAGDLIIDGQGNVDYGVSVKNNIYIGTWNIGKPNSSGEMDVWFSAKPFTINKGSTFSVSVCAETEELHKLDLKAKKDIEFPVGTVVTLPINI